MLLFYQKLEMLSINCILVKQDDISARFIIRLDGMFKRGGELRGKK
jgi:hypothetical protein